MRFLITLSVFLSALCLQALADETLDVNEIRSKDLEKLGSTSIPDPENLRKLAKSLFAKPVAQQSKEDLELLADASNRYANMVGYISEEYDSQYRENYRYEFVQKALAPAQSAYVKISNEFKGYRNQSYLNLGHIAKNSGRHIEALLFFRDAFRLSSFDCGKISTPAKCTRWLAEQEIQKLLNIEHIKAYVSWQK